ncbi:Glycine/D-amino acid oxidase [Paracoccus laeviglucosivorans]|uniref:Glycine/D-amino acid oxidase n=2 Tax=Paracoccus laeviglucosivorans TaxID=1197861 RepID=A0A521F9H4_9RHOB|nr:FAD-binding oxidoreductase [Paracoccus laeviglucosivorans]SMO92776.1 Glycine/D-amino acid oxidase [Paracoccus laeviglucosivorans]
MLDSDLTVDLAIVGGGFTGNAAALEAARRGATVAMFEAKTIGHGGSGRNVGLVNAGLWLPPEQVIEQMGAKAGQRLMGFLADAPARVWALIQNHGIDCEAKRNGTLHLAHSPAGQRDLARRHRQGRAMGWPVALLDASETARRTGSTAFHGALFDPRAGTIQPLSYVMGIARAATAAGAHLHEGSRVSHIRRHQGTWHLTVNGHHVRAANLLLATNAYFDGIEMGFQPRIVAVSYFQIATAPMPQAMRDRILRRGEGCWDTHTVMSSFRTDAAGRFIIGGIGNLEGPGRDIHLGWARRKLKQTFPELADLPFEYDWRGRIAMTSDHIPKLVRFGPDALAAFGYSGRGIGPGTTFGTLAAVALLENDDTVLPVMPVDAHDERLTTLREAYYESGAILTHAVAARG